MQINIVQLRVSGMDSHKQGTLEFFCHSGKRLLYKFGREKTQARQEVGDWLMAWVLTRKHFLAVHFWNFYYIESWYVQVFI